MEWNTVEKAIKTETGTRTEQKGVGKLRWFMSKTLTATSPPREGEPVGGGGRGKWHWICLRVLYTLHFIIDWLVLGQKRPVTWLTEGWFCLSGSREGWLVGVLSQSTTKDFISGLKSWEGWLVVILSPVNHKGLYQGWNQNINSFTGASRLALTACLTKANTFCCCWIKYYQVLFYTANESTNDNTSW